MDKPKIVTIFNNKGGVGKTTLTYHLAHALGEIGKRVLLIDLDPQCNLTISALTMEQIENIWTTEDDYIDDFDVARGRNFAENFNKVCEQIRSVHFLLKPTEDGTAEPEKQPKPAMLTENVHLIPGRLTLHMYEAKVAERWSGIYQGDPLAIRTATRVRSMSYEYAAKYNYDIVIFDTSPSLGALNKNLLSLADGFIIPCTPDLFSLYGIRNIGNSLKAWGKQFDSIYHFLSDQKRSNFPKRFVRFLGYTIYNAKKYGEGDGPQGLAKAHTHYADRIPKTITDYISHENMVSGPHNLVGGSIGNNAVIHSHNTFPSMSQKYHKPMWDLPNLPELDSQDRSTVSGNRQKYFDTRSKYIAFAEDFLRRVEYLDESTATAR